MTDLIAPPTTNLSYIEYRRLDDLLVWARNPKDHDIPNIKKSITRFGFTAPILIDERTQKIVAGHGRLESLKALRDSGGDPPARITKDANGEWLVPVLRGITFNSDAEIEAYLIADNQLTIAGGWDNAKLGAIMADLEQLGDGAFEGLGFNQAEIDAILTNLANQAGGASGQAQREQARRTLAEAFIVPPFSVLDARQGYWQDRKRAWIGLGIKSEEGRGQNLLKFSETAQIGVGGVKRTNKLTPGGGSYSEKTAWKNGAKGSNGKPLAEAFTSGKPGTLARLYAADNPGGRISLIQAEEPETGTSIFDPVLTEIMLSWFCNKGGAVLDPFAGGSVRGIVSGFLGYHYTGIDLSPEQISANQAQAAEIISNGAFYQPPAALPVDGLPLADNQEAAQAAGRPIIKPDILSVGAGGVAAVELYNATSSTPLQKDWQAPEELREYLELVYGGGNQPLDFISSGKAEPWTYLKDNGTCWVQFTGGKDSVAAALKAEALGYKVICYHLAGVNRGMGDEPTYARKICKQKGWELIIDKVHALGKKKGLIELPTKNQVTALAMLSRMAERGGAIWSAGWHEIGTQSRNGWEYDWSDGQDVIQAFDRYLAARYPGNKRLTLLRDTLDSWTTVADAGLIQFIKGCVCPPRFKDVRRLANIKKFGELLVGRCGSCVKCAWEQIALEDLGIIKPNPALRKHGEQFLLDFKAPGRETIPEIITWLMPPARIAELRKAKWAEQITPPDYIEPDIAPIAKPDASGGVMPAWIVGDSLDIDALLPAEQKFDFLLSCPPYHDLEQYSQDPKDLSNMTWDDFSAAYKSIIGKAVARLQDDRFAVFVVGEIRNQKGGGFYKGLVPLTIAAFEAAGARFYNDMILITAIGSLPIRIGKQFVGNRKIGKTHQNILIFYKGNPDRIKDNFPPAVPVADLSIFTDEG